MPLPSLLRPSFLNKKHAILTACTFWICLIFKKRFRLLRAFGDNILIRLISVISYMGILSGLRFFLCIPSFSPSSLSVKRCSLTAELPIGSTFVCLWLTGNTVLVHVCLNLSAVLTYQILYCATFVSDHWSCFNSLFLFIYFFLEVSTQEWFCFVSCLH